MTQRSFFDPPDNGGPDPELQRHFEELGRLYQVPVDPRWWLPAHGAVGILYDSDVPDMQKGNGWALRIMCDGKWHSRPYIEERHPQTAAMRRLRQVDADLRRISDGKAGKLRRHAPHLGMRMFEYRLWWLNDEA